MLTLNRLNRLTVTELQLNLLYEACVREKRRWNRMSQQADREGNERLISLTAEQIKAYENLMRAIIEAEILDDIAE